MRNLVKPLLIAASVLFSFGVEAQNEEDALRYSQRGLIGTARFVGMGGAFTALGGDLSSIGQNPGAVGIYRKSEFSFTPRFDMNNTSGEFNGSTTDADFNILSIGNISYLANFYTGRSNWKSASIAFGYNRTNNFHSEKKYDGISPGSSILDGYVDQLNMNGGTSEDDVFDNFPFGAGLAYYGYLINPQANDSMQYGHVLQNSDEIYQEMTITTTGGSGEYYFAFGGNFEDKIYVGGSLNLSTLRYDRDITYKEIPTLGDTDLVEMRMYDDLYTSGTGFNFNVGVILRATNWLRVGLALHSPTYYRLSDYWSTQIDAYYDNSDQFQEESPDGEFDYRLNTPGRVNTGIGIVVGQKGLISAEYEYVDYGLARLSTPRNTATGQYDFNLENDRIKSLYRSAANVKVGGEYRLDPLRIRAGYNYRGNTYTEESGEDNSANIYTFGLGFRKDDYFIDMAYSLQQTEQNYYAYGTIENPATFKSDIHSILFTLGLRF